MENSSRSRCFITCCFDGILFVIERRLSIRSTDSTDLWMLSDSCSTEGRACSPGALTTFVLQLRAARVISCRLLAFHCCLPLCSHSKPCIGVPSLVQIKIIHVNGLLHRISDCSIGNGDAERCSYKFHYIGVVSYLLFYLLKLIKTVRMVAFIE
jgi:hypothetical protein